MSILSEAATPAVKAWREGRYEGVTDTTRRLLEYWFFEHHWLDISEPFEFWDCQREAIETLIYLHEVRECRSLYDAARKLNASVRVDASQDNWPAYCFKMATGSGKTFVMALAMVWQYFNALKEDRDGYTNRFLLIAPNLIVLDRLLDGFDDGGVFGDFPFFVPHEWSSQFEYQVIKQDDDTPPHSRGILHVTNVHRFYEREEGEPENPIQELLGPRPVEGEELISRTKLKDILSRYDNIVVMNDEAHHAHIETEWNDALQEIHGQDVDITLQLDFTATAEDIARDQEVPLPHIVYDYPLKRAMDDGIVKDVQIASIQDAPPPVSEDFIERYEAEILTAEEKLERLKDDLGDVDKKPVLFAVCDNTDHADEVGEFFREELGYGDKVLVIHTYVRGGKYGGPGDVKKDDLELAREAAKKIDSNKYEVIVSVMMLKEGWDVRNVCVILPMRAFGSDILVEQTLGRGLRRMFPYDEDAVDRLYVIEHPSFTHMWEEKIEQAELPISMSDAEEAYEEPTLVRVDKNKMEYDIEVPVVRGGFRKRIPNIEQLSVTDLPANVRRLADIEVLEPKVIERRLQDGTVTGEWLPDFTFATDAHEYFAYLTQQALKQAGSAAQFHQLFPIVRDYMTRRFFEEDIEAFDEDTMGKLNTPVVRGRVGAVLVDALKGLGVVEEEYDASGVWTVGLTESFLTGNDTYRAQKTVFNCLPYPTNSTYEANFMRYLDGQPEVEAFTKFMRRFPIRISYLHPEGGVRRYVPDFIVETENTMYLVETKGEAWDQLDEVKPKAHAASEWCKNATEISDKPWHYRKIREQLFKQNRYGSFHNLMMVAEEDMEQHLADI